MRKITFERAVLIVFILIILISTSNITGKYISIFINKFDKPIVSTVPSRSPGGFPTMLINEDNLYASGDYAAAAEQYLAKILNNTLTIEQKIHAYFNLGVCHYNLGNYEKASKSFSTVASLSPDDDVAYNNAAVSAYRAMDMKSAIELQQKAVEILPAVEYYYNLARIYEDNEEYENAAKSYLFVVEGEQNITKVESIDPVRVKEKMARLLPKDLASVSKAANNVLYALRLKDNRVTLTINENEMKLKQGDFIVKVENQRTAKNIVAEYDRKKYDPYNLISELLWTVYRDGKEIYKKSGDKITTPAIDGGNYEVKLTINSSYSDKEMVTTKTVRVKENQSTIDIGSKDEVVVKSSMNEDMKIYPGAVYEQLFENNFKILSVGYTDKYNVIWGKDSGVETSLGKLKVDKLSSLVVNNISGNDAGLWINLDSLLKEESIKGKSISISFFAREIVDNSDVYISARIKSDNMISTTHEMFQFPYQFKQKSIRVFVPDDANGFTISIKTKAGGQFNIDAFTIID